MERSDFVTETNSCNPSRNNKENMIVQTLLDKRENLMKELKQIDQSIVQVREEFTNRLSELQDKKKPIDEAIQHVEALLQYEGWSGNHQYADTEKRGSNVSIGDAVFDLLKEVNEPLHYQDITERLLAKGIYIFGQDPAATLLSRISRDTKRFKRVKRGTYALAAYRMPKTKGIRSTSRKRKSVGKKTAKRDKR